MLFHEFMAGTGCRDTEYNHKVYKDLEVMYMHSELTKQDIYAYGIKLVDNSLTPAEIEHNKRIQAELDSMKSEIKSLSESAKSDTAYAAHQGDPAWRAFYKASAKEKRRQATVLREKLRLYKDLLIIPGGDNELLQAK